MTNMRRYIQIVEDADHYFANEAAVSESDLRQIFDGTFFLAAKERQTVFGAALVYALRGEDRIAYFNQLIIPMWQEHGMPIPGKPPYARFQDDLMATWKAMSSSKGTFDPEDYDQIKKAVGLKIVEDVFHGTPHSFEKFSLDHTKTGEGHHAYGWGLYFASNKEVADFYRITLSAGKSLGVGSTRHIGDQPTAKEREAIREVNKAFRIALDSLDVGTSDVRPFRTFHDFYNFTNEVGEWDDRHYEAHRNEIEQQIAQLDVAVRKKNPDWSDAQVQGALEWTGVLKKRKPFTHAYRDALKAMGKYAGGHLYHVQIPDEARYLLWDEDFKAQSPFVKRALKQLAKSYGKHLTDCIKENDRGQIIYAHMSNYNRNVARVENEYQKTSLDLASVGIVGNKYLDGDSRDNGEGHYNYVIFDDKDVSIKGVE